MNVAEIAERGATELAACVSRVDPEQLDNLMREIDAADRVYAYGAGRSLLQMRCFAMRLMHLGLTSYVVGDTTTPAFGPGDLLVVASASGTTSGVVRVARKAKDLGGCVAVLTTRADSELALLADVTIVVPAYTDKVPVSVERLPVFPGGSLFEQSVLVLGDALVMPLAERRGVPTNRMFALHANLE